MSDPIDEAKSEVSEALKARGPEPAEDAEQAARQVEELRGAVTRDLDVLRGRLPDPAEVSGQARTVGAAVGVGLTGAGALVLVLRRRARRREEERRVKAQAVALARELARLELEPQDLADDGRSGTVMKVIALLAAIAGAVAAAVAVRQRLQGDDATWEA